MPVSPEIKAAVQAAHGKESASQLGKRYGLTRNQVIGLWHRRPRGAPEEPGETGAPFAADDGSTDAAVPEVAPVIADVAADVTPSVPEPAPAVVPDEPVAPVSPEETPRPAAAAPALSPAKPALVPRRRDEPAMPSGLTGAAAAVASLRPGCCRWPIGDSLDEDFRFCCAPVRDEGKSYCPEHRVAGSAGRWSASKAAA